MHGNQNDFIVFSNKNNFLRKQELSVLAVRLCERKASIGADGILVLEEDNDTDFRMRIFNADGSEAEMCGNGAKCIAKYACDQKLCHGSKISFSTIAGVMRAEVSETEVALNMGKIDIQITEGMLPDEKGGGKLSYAFLNVAVPHCVIFAENLDLSNRKELFDLGRKIRKDTAKWPNGANVNFAKKLGGEVWAITYERGVEELTESCGTGCVATAIAMALMRGEPSPMKIRNSGGVNEVFLDFSEDKKSCGIILKGRVETAYTGEVEL